MNICLIAYWYSNLKAEAIVSSKLAWCLAEYGHTVTFYCAEIGDVPCSALKYHDAIRVVQLPLPLRTPCISHNNWFSRIRNYLSGVESEEEQWIQDVVQSIVVDNRNAAYDIIYSRLEPYLCHVIGFKAKRLLKHARWIGYFSDPWPHNFLPYPYKYKGSLLRKLRFYIMLLQHLRAMDVVVYPSLRQSKHISRRVFNIGRKKTRIVPHLSVWWMEPESVQIELEDSLLIRYAGTITRWRPIEPLYAAIDLLRENGEVDLRIEIMGRLFGDNGQALGLDERYSDCISIQPSRPIDEAFLWLREADAALLIEGDFREGIFMPSKLADILESGIALLAISPIIGTVADLKEGFNKQGKELLIASPNDPIKIAEAVKKLYNAKRNSTLGHYCPPSSIRKSVGADSIMRLHAELFASD